MDPCQESAWYVAIDLLMRSGGVDLQLQTEKPKEIIRTNFPVLSESGPCNIIPTS